MKFRRIRSQPLSESVKTILLSLGLVLLWFLFADQATAFLFREEPSPLIRQTSGWWALVGATGVLLLFVSRKTIRRLATSRRPRADNGRYLDSIFRASPTGIGVVSNRVILTVNDRLCAMTGYSREELIGRSTRIFYPSDAEYQAVGSEKYEQISQTGIGTLETRWRRKNGTLLDILLSSSPILADRLAEGVTFTALDITALKQTERSLRENEHYYRTLIDLAVDGILLGTREGVIIDSNNQMCAMLGMEREALIGRHVSELPFTEASLAESPFRFDLLRQGQVVLSERVLVRPDGRQLFVEMRTKMMPNGTYQSIYRDISQRKQAEADLERLRVAIEQAGEVVVITDVEGAIQYANPAFVRVTGYAVSEVVGQNPRILKSDAHDQAFYKTLWETIVGGRTWSGQLINKRKDGTLYTEEATISPVFDDHGAIVNFVAIKRDITAQLKLEEQYLQAQKMESVGRLTGGVAHDFNNLLAVIIGYCEMALQKTADRHAVHEDLRNIHLAANRSADIVRQLLAFSRKQPIDPKILDLNEVVEGMLPMLRRLIGEDIELIWSPQAGLPPINIDPAQIDQILANLCVNARDAIRGTGTITLRTATIVADAAFRAAHPEAMERDYVVLSVADDGCGMEPELLGKVFEPFFTTKGALGTGLGLATVYGIVQQNQALIATDSEPGRGTTFSVYLPVHAGEQAPGRREQPEPVLPGNGETLLLVEDDQGILDVARTMLDALGYGVLSAQSPGEALRLAARHEGKIDLLLTDVIMPEMNGRELARQLTAMRPGMKLLYMSGYTAEAIAQRGMLDQEVDFLQKPFRFEELSRIIRRVLDGETP